MDNKSVPSFLAGINFAHTKYYYNPCFGQIRLERNSNRSDSIRLTLRQSKNWRFKLNFWSSLSPMLINMLFDTVKMHKIRNDIKTAVSNKNGPVFEAESGILTEILSNPSKFYQMGNPWRAQARISALITSNRKNCLQNSNLIKQ